jgi:hypothetical protein
MKQLTTGLFFGLMAGVMGHAASACTYQDQEYEYGQIVCINHYEYKCGKHGWYKDSERWASHDCPAWPPKKDQH